VAEKGGLQPHLSRYWMHPVVDDEAEFEAALRHVVGLKEAAPELAKQNVRVISCDEKTSIQALERLKTWPMAQGRPARRESWYRRHGTLCLTANMDLADGKLVSPTIEETRTNAQFLAHVQRTVATDPEASWVFIVDNLDTHKSALLVEWVASLCAPMEDLGKLWTRGHLTNRASRTAFLSRQAHRIRFAYTPKHCSWLNEIERWFSKLARSVLRRGSFASKQDLKGRLSAYIDYYNIVEARPHRSRTTADEMLRKMRIGTSEVLN
jgi:hypothetical protein